jgi:hypothetical protein
VYQPPGGGQPPYGTPQPFYPQQPPPSRANGPLIAAIGCGALVIIGALVAVLVILVSNRDSDDESPPPVAEPSVRLSVPEPTLPSPSVSAPSYTRPDCQFGADDTFLPDCAGTWSGAFIQTKPTVVRYSSSLRVTGEAKTASISFSGNGLDCSGTLTILSNTGGYKALVRTDITSGRSTGVCASVTYGTITPSAITGPERLILQLHSSRTAAENNSASNSVGGLEK